MNYSEARLLYESDPDCTLSELARKMGKTPQAVSKYAKKHEWKKAEHSQLTVSDDSPIVNAVSGSKRGLRCKENLQVIVNAYAVTGNKKLAAGVVGITPETLRLWCKEEPQLLYDMDSARKNELIQHYSNISQAGKRDWKASKEILSRAPETKDEWGEQDSKGPTVVLNILRS